MNSGIDIFCVVIPTYNNAGTIRDVVSRALEYVRSVIVVNDGSTDGTAEILEGLPEGVTVVSCDRNRGKGKALRAGFAKAMEMGFRHAVTMDADGQHLASDLPLFAEAIAENPDALVVGSRPFDDPNMPGKSTFANRFSNFWFALQTLRHLPDTQTGYRAYPLTRMGRMRLCTSRYEAELEMLVRCAWRGIRLIPIPVHVYYPPREERVSHFRPAIDFARISVLNTVLCIFAIIYGYPRIFVNKLTGR